MPLVTETLRECHRLRKHIRELQVEIERGPRVLKARQDGLEEARRAHDDHHEAIRKLKLKQRDEEGTLKQTDTRLQKLEQQLQGISVPKEYDAKQSEINQARAKKDELEDVILTTITKIEELTAAIPAVEKTWADAQAEFAEYQKEAAERLQRLQADQEQCRQALARAEATIPEDNRPRYDNLVRVHGPDAFAALRGKVCQSCRTSMHEQKQYEILTGVFMLCPTCGKMLYPLEPAVSKDKDE
jgi:predicted  nucleic acid-binding Zn-ribbon protein